jgi:primosomal replication protein N
VNRIFLSGKLKTKPEVVYTPKGERVVMFLLWVEEGTFSIDVVLIDRQGIKDFGEMVGRNIMVSGMLTKTMVKSHDVFKLKANKILWMEE